MNPAALKTNIKFTTANSIIIIDADSFGKKDLEKALYKTEDAIKELGITNQVVEAPITSLCRESLKDSGMDNRSILRSKTC